MVITAWDLETDDLVTSQNKSFETSSEVSYLAILYFA